MNSLRTLDGLHASFNHVLVVEDDPVLREMAVHWLQQQRLTVRTAGSAEEARTALARERFAVVATDIGLPGQSGLELLDHVRNVDGDAQVVILTARDDAQTAISALTRGAFGYLIKPFDQDAFGDHVRRALDQYQLVVEHRRYTQDLERLVRKQTKHLQLAHEETIHRLVNASLMRDEETGAHIKRVGLFSEALARAIGWGEERVAAIRLAAPMHDVGKIGIPDGILRKAGPLTPYEFDIMKTHTEIGAEILSGSNWPVLVLAHEIALSHHERWDGFGYPRGLTGDSIPESARIVSIADVFDALTHDRIYRSAFALPEACQMMRGERGRQFEPRLLDTFFAILPTIQQISGEHPDEPAGGSAQPVATWHELHACELESR